MLSCCQKTAANMQATIGDRCKASTGVVEGTLQGDIEGAKSVLRSTTPDQFISFSHNSA